MHNKITDKYFTQGDFAKKEKEVLEKVLPETGFKIEKEIFRGEIYESDKVGSLIYKGKWHNRPAVLKLQGLKPEIDEVKMIKEFAAQSGSRKVRLPKLYDYRLWRSDRGYGYQITEYIAAPKIFTLPWATKKQMRDFAVFYQEYRAKAVCRAWLKADTRSVIVYQNRKIKHWLKIAGHKNRIRPEEYLSYLSEFKESRKRFFSAMPMVFGHGHLTADDINKMPNGEYVLMSNLFWSFRPEWYDLAFNLWACILSIRDTKVGFNKASEYLDRWLAVYRKIPIVKKDKNFDRKIYYLLLERLIGIMIVDLGANMFFGRRKNKKYLKHLLKLCQNLFDYYAGLLEKIALK